MFDLFSWQHIVLLLVVALVVVGPKDLPRLMNMMGRWAGKARAMANEFRRSFDEMARQAELDELRKEIDELKKNNPVSGIAQAMDEVQNEIDRQVAMPETSQESTAVSEPPVEGSSELVAGESEATDKPASDSTSAAAQDAPAP